MPLEIQNLVVQEQHAPLRNACFLAHGLVVGAVQYNQFHIKGVILGLAQFLEGEGILCQGLGRECHIKGLVVSAHAPNLIPFKGCQFFGDGLAFLHCDGRCQGSLRFLIGTLIVCGHIKVATRGHQRLHRICLLLQKAQQHKEHDAHRKGRHCGTKGLAIARQVLCGQPSFGAKQL